jgi:hypothetical protein
LRNAATLSGTVYTLDPLVAVMKDSQMRDCVMAA